MRKIAFVAALLASSPAFACCDIPSPDMGAFFQQQPVPYVSPQQSYAPQTGYMPLPQQRNCTSYPVGNGWQTTCN